MRTGKTKVGTEYIDEENCRMSEKLRVGILGATGDVYKRQPLHCVRRPASVLRRETYASLGKKRRVLNAEGVFGALLEDKPDLERLRRLKEEFYVDDHSLWSGGKRLSLIHI